MSVLRIADTLILSTIDRAVGTYVGAEMTIPDPAPANWGAEIVMSREDREDLDTVVQLVVENFNDATGQWREIFTKHFTGRVVTDKEGNPANPTFGGPITGFTSRRLRGTIIVPQQLDGARKQRVGARLFVFD